MMAVDTSATPGFGDPTALRSTPLDALSSAASSLGSSAIASDEDSTSLSAPQSRPQLGLRKGSGSMIVPRDLAQTVVDPDLDENDVRSMSPRRNSEEVDKLGEEARKDLIEQAKLLQTSLQQIVDRVEAVKSEHEKLEGGNKFLQSYIGELMQSSRVTSTALPKTKAKARSGK